jgi:peptide deformylase
MLDIEKCSLTRYPAKVLAGPARRIEKIDDSIRRLVEKMTDIMLKNKGVGLAGPQVGLSLRIFIIALDASRESVRTYINPTVTPTTDQLQPMEEGCLSVPGVHAKIRRYAKCRVTATDLDGNEFTEEAEGLYARALQHEFDHLEGFTIINRMSPTGRIAHRRQLKRLEQENKR